MEPKKTASIEEESENRIEWFWVVMGSIVGLILIGSFMFISSAKYSGSATIPTLIGGLAFAITGMILGHYSPGHTVKEAAIAGLIIPIVGFIFIHYGYGPSFIGELQLWQQILLVVCGIAICQLGGWVGEELEGYDHPTRLLQWHWIIVASVIGFMLNCFILFFVTLFVYKLIPITIFLCLSVLLSGLIAGYKSPGHTEKECSIAGAVTIILDYLFIRFALDIESDLLPLWMVLTALVLGAGFGLLGGWIGERMQTEEENEKKELE
jgi:hypothetical protein